MKIPKTKTNFSTDALNLANYLYINFVLLKDHQIDLDPKTSLLKKIQIYLDKNKERIHHNNLLGIIGVHDNFRNHTGGRIHLVVGLQGPLVEAIQRQVVPQPIDYESKSKLLIKALENVSGSKAPKVGNIHFHLFLSNGRSVTPKVLLDFIRDEHGHQNDLQHIADAHMYKFAINTKGEAVWEPNVNSEVIADLFA